MIDTQNKNTIILTEKQAAKRLSLGYSTLKRFRGEKRINFVRIGNHRIGYTLKNLENFIKRNAVES